MSQYNQNQYDEVMSKLDAAKPVAALRDPYIPEGTHESLVITQIESFRNQANEPCVRASFIVEKSQVVAAGTALGAFWNLAKPSPKPGMTTDADRFVDFVCTLQGTRENYQASCRALLKTRAEGGNMESQPARGARVGAKGVSRITKTGVNAGKSYTIVEWQNIPQQDIANTRAHLDATMPLKVAAAAPVAQFAAPAPAAPAVAPTPAFGFFGGQK